MAINERIINAKSEAAAAGDTGEEGLILHLDANDVDSYDGDGTVWYDISDHEYKPTTDVSEHFNTVTYEGTGASNPITDVGFQPDLIWIKNRESSALHYLVDTVRGNGTSTYKNLASDSTAAEGTTTASGITNSTIIDGGFTLQGTGARTNADNIDYVAWCFKAGGAPSGSDKVSIDGTSYATMTAAGLTDGTVGTNKLSVNTKLGFSIATYDGNNSTGTVAHGLGVKPEMIIIKNIEDGNTVWTVYHSAIGATKYLSFNTDEANTASNRFNNTEPTSTVWSFGTSDNVHQSGEEHIVYSFTSKRGVSKVGSYTGTGAAGNKVYTGFEPAWIMIKNSSGGEWNIYDNKRDTANPRDVTLWANADSTEATASQSGVYDVDFNRDGFTIQNAYSPQNQSGAKILYLAFAKNTNETDLIDDTDLEFHLDADSFPQKGESGYSNTPTTWEDKTSNNYDGTITNATFDSELGNWLNFDGNGDNVTTTYDAPTGAKTLEVWFNAASSYNATYQGVLGGGNEILWLGGNLTSAYTNESILWYQNPSELGLAIRDGKDKYLDNKWHHLVIVDTGSAHKMYLDGENKSFTYQYGSGSVRFDWDNLVLGRGYRTNGTDDFTGKIGQVRVYSSALTESQVRQNFNFTKNNYPNGVNGTLTNMSSSDWNSSGYFTFSDNDDRIQPSFQPTVTSPFTMAVWVKRESGNSGFKTVIDYTQNNPSNSIYPGIGISHSGTGDYNIALNGGTSVTIGSATSNFDHLVFVYNGGTSCKTYINGVGTSQTLSAAIAQPNSSTNFVVGNSYVSTWNASRMSVSDVKFFNRALTDGEVTAEHTKGYNGIG